MKKTMVSAEDSQTFAAPHLAKPSAKLRWYRNMGIQMIVALIIGGYIGHVYPDIGLHLSPLSAAFLKLIKAMVGVVIFTTIVTGIANLGSGSNLGRLGFKSILYFEVLTTLAMIIGLVIANSVQLGSGMNVDFHTLDAGPLAQFKSTAEHRTAIDWLLSIIPDTFVTAFTNGNLLCILLVAVLFGVALLKMGSNSLHVVRLIEGVSEAMFKIVGMIMILSPLAVMGAISFTVAKYGITSMLPLAKLLLVFYASCILFITLILGSVCISAKLNLWTLIKYLRVELMLGFGTASSEAVLPSMMAKLERAGCSKHIVGFVVPAGFSFNLDGSSMYFIMAIVFVAQACNIELSLAQEISLILIFMVTSKGIAGVAGAGFVTLAATLAIFPSVPLAGIVLLLGIDRFMDAMRTTTNLIGNAVATMALAKWENARDDAQMARAFEAG